MTDTKVAKTEGMDEILKNEANAKRLSKTKVFYSCRGEEEDTLIFRDLSTRTHFDHFGIKGIDELKWAFFFILWTMSEHQTKLTDGSDDRDGLHSLLKNLDNEDQDEMRTALDNDNPITSSIKISVANLDTYPQLKLMRHDVDGKVKNGIYLFMSDAVRLFKHMNNIFKFGKSASLSSTKTVSIKKYADDYFFWKNMTIM